MTKLVQVRKLELVAIEPDQVGLDVEAALSNNEGGEDNHAIKNTTFNVRVGVNKVYEGKSDARTGVFSAKKIPIGEVGPQVDVVISGNDGVDSTSFEITLNTESVMMRIADMRREREAAAVIVKPEPAKEEPKLSIVEEAERQRELKELVKNALRNTGSDNRSVAEAAFKILVEHQDHPLIDREIYNTAEANSDQFIRCAGIYYQASWAKYVLDVLAKKEPQKVLGKFHEFSQYDFAEYIVHRIVIYHDRDLAFSEIETYEFMPWAEGIAMRAAQDNPYSAIEHYPKYRDQPWAEGVLAHAKVAQEKYEARIEMWNKISAAREIFGQPHNEADLVNAFSLFVKHQHEHGMEGIMSSMAEYYPEIFRKYKDHYRQAVWGEKIIKMLDEKQAAVEREEVGRKIDAACELFSQPHKEEDEVNAFKFFVEYQHDDRIEGSLTVLVGYFPETFLKHFPLYREAVWGEAITKKLTECSPLAKHSLLMERFYGQSSTPESLTAALDYSVAAKSWDEWDSVFSVLLECFEKLENCSWIKDVLQITAQRVESRLKMSGMKKYWKRIETIYLKYEGESWCEKLLDSAKKGIKKEEEYNEWQKKAKADPSNTVWEVLSHFDEGWAYTLLSWMCRQDLGCLALYESFDSYAEKRGGLSLFLRVVERAPYLPLDEWPTNTYGHDDDIIDAASINCDNRSIPSSDNRLVRFCLENPESDVAKKFIARLSVTKPEFAKHLVKPNAAWAFIKEKLGL